MTATAMTTTERPKLALKKRVVNVAAIKQQNQTPVQQAEATERKRANHADMKPAKPPKPKDPRKDPDFVGYIPTKKQRSAMRRMVTEERKAKHRQYMETSSAQGYTDRKRINATMRRLYTIWNECKPLAKNAQKTILNAIKDALPDIPRKAAKDAISWHTKSRRYLENVAKGGARYTLDGVEQGEVLPYEIEHTLTVLAKYQARSEQMRGTTAKHYLGNKAGQHNQLTYVQPML